MRACGDSRALASLTLPDAVRAWFRLNDGIATESGANGEELFGLSDMVATWKQLKGMAKQPGAEPPRDGVKAVFWSVGWVPLTHNGGGDHACLDLDPAKGTAPGQVIQLWHDALERPVLAKTFLDWLEGIFWGAWE